MNKSLNTKTLSLLILLIVTTACATQSTEQKINEKVAQHSDVKTIANVEDEFERDLINSNLSEGEKVKIKELKERVLKRNRILSEEENQLRSVLLEDLISKKASDKEVTKIKRRLFKTHQAKLENQFNALDEAQEILGKKTMSQKRGQAYSYLFDLKQK